MKLETYDIPYEVMPQVNRCHRCEAKMKPIDTIVLDDGRMFCNEICMYAGTSKEIAYQELLKEVQNG